MSFEDDRARFTSPEAPAWAEVFADLGARASSLSALALRDALVRRAEVLIESAPGAARLLPEGLRGTGGFAQREFLLREAGREVRRQRYTLDDPTLAKPDLSLLSVAAREARASNELRETVRELGDDLYAGAWLSADFCARLLAEVDRHTRWSREHALGIVAPNSMNRYGVLLDDLGLGPLLDALLAELVRPLARVLYPHQRGAELQLHHGFVVEYGEEADTDLAFHVDDSHVTLNLCLGEQFEGGDLMFRGLRCAEHRDTGWLREESVRYAHRPGHALLHAGCHRHEAFALRSGRRVNLILWCKADRAPAAPVCDAWCGAHPG